MDNMDGDTIKSKIEYLTYCHETINGLKSSIYERASILVLVIAFIVPSCSSIIQDILKYISPDLKVWRVIVAIVSVMFLISFLLSAFWGIKCLIPIKSRDFLLKLLNKSRNKGNCITIEQLQNANQDLSIHEFLSNQNVVDNKRVRVFTTFDHIADLNEEEFNSMVEELDNEKILEQLVSAIYNISHISRKRYNDLLKAYKFLMISIIIFILLIVADIVIKIV